MENKIILLLIFSPLQSQLYGADSSSGSSSSSCASASSSATLNPAEVQAQQKSSDAKNKQEGDILTRLVAHHSDDLLWHILHNYWRPMRSTLIADNTRALVPMVIKASEGRLLLVMGRFQSLLNTMVVDNQLDLSETVVLKTRIGTSNLTRWESSCGPYTDIALMHPNSTAAQGYSNGRSRWYVHPLRTAQLKRDCSVEHVTYMISLSNAAAQGKIQLDDKAFATHCSLPPRYSKRLEANYDFDFTDAQKIRLAQLAQQRLASTTQAVASAKK